MTTRNTTFQLKSSNTPNQAYPSNLLQGEPIINTADGIMLFSGVTTSTSGWTQSPSGATFFEVGSNLYDLKIRNQIISYSGITNLSGKFLSGTSNGFVLANISDITTTGGTASGDYLPLSGGTVTGGTIFQSGVTANTLSEINYIDFKTSPTVPSPTGGTLYFDSTENALSYKPITPNNDVTVNLGQESLIRIYNNLGFQINNGQALHITGSTSGSPTVTLAIGTGGDTTQFQVSGIATHDIPNSSFGFMTVFGVVRDINLIGFTVGEQVYLSQTVPGGISSYSGLSFTGRTCEIGHVIDNSASGKLQVTILNEIEGTIITTQENNILAANNSSTGIFEFSGLSISTPSGTTFNVGEVKGWIIDNVTSPTNPTIQLILYTGSTGNTALYVSSATETYILLTSGLTITQQTTFPTPQQRRQNLYLGKFGHGNRQFLINAFNEPDTSLSPVSQLRDMFTSIKLINDGVIASANGPNLNINTSAGILYGLGIGYITNKLNPNSLSVGGQSPATFQYRTSTGGTASNTTLIDPGSYDLNGVITPITGTKATNQRIYLLQNGQIRIQYGQTEYNQLAAAVAGLQNEVFVTFPNFRDNGILIGILSVLSTATVLNDTSKAQFFSVSKFGELIGAAGGTSTTTLQQAYNNSSTPEIVINSTLDGLSIKNGTGNADNVSNLIEGINASNITTSFIRADGAFSGTSIYGTGLSATTISATTYQNLPTDVRTTGATYSNNTFTFTNNTGGTYSVLFNTVTGLTVNGNLSVTGTTSSETISATTYLNLPTDVRVTGGTFTNLSAGTTTFTNNTGGTFNVTGYTYGTNVADGIEYTPFVSSFGNGFNSNVRVIEVQPDNKVLVGGSFTLFNTTTIKGLVRLNSDGTEDVGFTTNLGTGFVGTVYDIKLQSDGKIVVAGDFTDFNGNGVPDLVRLNSDGTEDTIFTTNIGTSSDNRIFSIAIQDDGKIVLGGNFSDFDGNGISYLVRLNPDGTEDTTFTTTIGSSFDGAVNTIKIQYDGQILLGGNFTNFDVNTSKYICRLDWDGNFDSTFNTNLGGSFDDEVYVIEIQNDNKILVGGIFIDFDTNTSRGLARLNEDGTFNYGRSQGNVVYAISSQCDRKFIVGEDYGGFKRYNSNTSLDTIFSNNLGSGFFNGTILTINTSLKGLIFVGGSFGGFNSFNRPNFETLNDISHTYICNSDYNLGGVPNTGLWRYNSDITALSNPHNGIFVTDTNLISGITKISIANYSSTGIDYQNWLGSLLDAMNTNIGNTLSLIDVENNQTLGIFNLTTVTSAATYYNIDISSAQVFNGKLRDGRDYVFNWGTRSSSFTGGTVSGPTNFTSGLTASTISATTIYGDGSNLTGVATFQQVLRITSLGI